MQGKASLNGHGVIFQLKCAALCGVAPLMAVEVIAEAASDGGPSPDRTPDLNQRATFKEAVDAAGFGCLLNVVLPER